jgi:hypothetical protein
MKLMSCFDNFQADRTCELCKIANHMQYRYCKQLMQLKKEIEKCCRISECEYAKERYEEWQPYTECVYFKCDCKPRELCMKSEYDKAVSEYNTLKEGALKSIRNQIGTYVLNDEGK